MFLGANVVHQTWGKALTGWTDKMSSPGSTVICTGEVWWHFCRGPILGVAGLLGGELSTAMGLLLDPSTSNGAVEVEVLGAGWVAAAIISRPALRMDSASPCILVSCTVSSRAHSSNAAALLNNERPFSMEGSNLWANYLSASWSVKISSLIAQSLFITSSCCAIRATSSWVLGWKKVSTLLVLTSKSGRSPNSPASWCTSDKTSW